MKIIYSAKSITGLKKTKGESGLSMHTLFTATLPLSETPECFESGKDMNWGRVRKVARYRNKVTKLETQVCLSWSCLFSLAAVVLYAFYMYLCNVWYVCVYIHIHRYSILIYYWINYWLLIKKNIMEYQLLFVVVACHGRLAETLCRPNCSLVEFVCLINNWSIKIDLLVFIL